MHYAWYCHSHSQHNSSGLCANTATTVQTLLLAGGVYCDPYHKSTCHTFAILVDVSIHPTFELYLYIWKYTLHCETAVNMEHSLPGGLEGGFRQVTVGTHRGLILPTHPVN